METSDSSDLQLLEDVARGLVVFESFNLSISNARELLDRLVSLCKVRLERVENIQDSVVYQH